MWHNIPEDLNFYQQHCENEPQTKITLMNKVRADEIGKNLLPFSLELFSV